MENREIKYNCHFKLRCKQCNNILPRRKPSEQGLFCNRACYTKSRMGTLRGAYKESVFISGYRFIQSPHHPNATKKGYVSEHRLVAEKTIGRYLTENEVAHHINEIKLDNRPENIQVMTRSEHSQYHQNFRKCKTEQ